MKPSNALNSHHPESLSSRADKMSGLNKITNIRNSNKSVIKWFYGRKRRMFLKNPENWDKI